MNDDRQGAVRQQRWPHPNHLGRAARQQSAQRDPPSRREHEEAHGLSEKARIRGALEQRIGRSVAHGHRCARENHKRRHAPEPRNDRDERHHEAIDNRWARTPPALVLLGGDCEQPGRAEQAADAERPNRCAEVARIPVEGRADEHGRECEERAG